MLNQRTSRFRAPPARSAWHERVAAQGHYRGFEHLARIHRLTLEWIRELSLERPPYAIPRRSRGLGAAEIALLGALERAVGARKSDERAVGARSYDDLLDDTSPEDVLGRLTHAVWVAQALTLTTALAAPPATAREQTLQALEQVAWRLGREDSAARWAGLSPATQANAAACARAIDDVPFLAVSPARRLGRVALARRAVATEAVLELLCCAHEIESLEVLPVADALCRMHRSWIKGYAYGMSDRLHVEDSRPGRCVLSWRQVVNS